MKSFLITLTEAEVNATLQIIDIATKASGIQIAEVAVTLFKKFHAAELIEAPLASPEKPIV